MKIKIIKKAHRATYAEWCDDLKTVPREEQRQWIFDSLKSKRNLHIFGRYFFPHFIKNETAPCHLELIEELASEKDSAAIFPRGFAKTTWEKIDTIHDMVYILEPVILYVSSTFAAAQLHLEHIKMELESNELLISIYGNHAHTYGKRSYHWNLRRLQTSHGVNLVARGRGKGRGVNINGQRPTKIIVDDVEDDQQVRSVEQREKLHDWLYRVVFPSKDQTRGKIKMIGTVLSPLCEVLNFYRMHGGIFRKAIENGESIWDSMYPLSKLQEIKEKIGTFAFAQEYLNTPVNAETAIIKPEWIERVYYQDLDTRGMKRIIMFDPQAGEKKGADYFGLCTIAFFEREMYRYVLEIQTGRATQIDQAALVVRTWQKNPDALYVGIEKVLTQVAVYQLILDWMAKKIDLPDVNNDNRNISLIAVSPEGKDKVARLQMHQAAFERGEIRLHSTMRTFGEKLTCFPAVEHDDDIDALIYCLEYANRNVSFGDNDTPTESDYDERDSSVLGNVWKKTF